MKTTRHEDESPAQRAERHRRHQDMLAAHKERKAFARWLHRNKPRSVTLTLLP